MSEPYTDEELEELKEFRKTNDVMTKYTNLVALGKFDRLITTVDSLKEEILHFKIVVVDQEKANAKLKEDYYAPTVTIRGLREENEKVEEENAKLKENISTLEDDVQELINGMSG